MKNFSSAGETATFLILSGLEPGGADIEFLVVHTDVGSALGIGLHHESCEPSRAWVVTLAKGAIATVGVLVVKFSLITWRGKKDVTLKWNNLTVALILLNEVKVE